MSFAEKYDYENNLNINVKIYFAKQFISRNRLMYKKLHGEALSADQFNLKNFVNDFVRVMERYGKNVIYNFDETSLFIKKYWG